MDGKEPMYVHPPKPGNAHHTYLDEAGFTFVAKCFQTLESRGTQISYIKFGNCPRKANSWRVIYLTNDYYYRF